MTTYKILSVSQVDEIVITKVEYTIDSEVIVVDIPHFAPKSQEDIDTGIANRVISEKVRLENKEIAEKVKDSVIIGEKVLL